MAEEERLIGLMIAYQSGELSAFEQLYALLVDEVHRYFGRAHGNRGVAPDLVQETFLEMHRSRRTYTPPLPVRPWVFGIARNVSARSFRAARLRLQMHAIDAQAALPSRGLPNRPALTGALCGLGVGFMGDAGRRLLCWNGDFAHVILAHGAAIAMLVGLGALSAILVERVKSRRRP